MEDRFGHDVYVVRRKGPKLLGNSLHILDEGGNLVFFVETRAFSTKRDIRFYTEHDHLNEVHTLPDMIDAFGEPIIETSVIPVGERMAFGMALLGQEDS